MQNKRMVIGMVLLLAFSLTWNPLWEWLGKKYHWKMHPDPPVQTTPPQAAVTPPATGPATTGPTTLASTGPTTAGTVAAVTPAPPAAPTPKGGEASVATIGRTDYDPDPKGTKTDCPIGVKITSRGAGIEAVYLNRFKRDVDRDDPYVFQKPYDATTEFATPLATRAISINGGPMIGLWSYNWKPVAPTSQTITDSASFSIDVPNPAGGDIVVTKTYTAYTAKEKDKGSGYEINIEYTFSNPTTQPVKVKTAFNGPTSPQPENNRDVSNVVAGFDNQGNVLFKFKDAPGLKATALDLTSLAPKYGMLWAGFSSNYFDAIVRPVDAAGKSLGVADAKAWSLHPDEKLATAKDPVVAMEAPEITVPAHGTASFALKFFAGPKQRELLKGSDTYYGVPPMDYDQTLVMSSGVCAICTWDWLINALVGLLNLLHAIFIKDWGLAIIGLVVIVRLLLHPITKRSQVSMSRMTKMGPEMEKLKKKYADDKEGLAKAQMQLYKEQGIAPILGCLPMFLQMPIWIALWQALQSTFEIRHAPFLWFGRAHLTWIKDLSQPDQLFMLKEPVGFWIFSVSALNLLPILMGIIFWIQQKFMPSPMAASPEQAQQQKMMKWLMPFMMPLFLYSSPSGLNLYILTSTAIGIWESKRVRDHIKQQEEREKSGLVIVDAPDGDSGGAGVYRGKPPAPAAPTGFIGRLMARAQKMAEDAQKQAKAQQPLPKRKKK